MNEQEVRAKLKDLQKEQEFLEAGLADLQKEQEFLEAGLAYVKAKLGKLPKVTTYAFRGTGETGEVVDDWTIEGVI